MYAIYRVRSEWDWPGERRLTPIDGEYATRRGAYMALVKVNEADEEAAWDSHAVGVCNGWEPHGPRAHTHDFVVRPVNYTDEDYRHELIA